MSGWILITGATGGLGKAFCAACARRGYSLFLTDLSGQALDTLAAGLHQEFGVDVRMYACDLAHEWGRDELYAELETLPVRFTGLINVAGVDVEGEFASRSLQGIRTMMQLNMMSAAENINRILRLRAAGQRFMIINVASFAAFQPMPYKALYSATKRFLLQLTLGVREELKAENVTLTALCPCGMPTNPECIECINVQGLAGLLTTQNTGDVAEVTLKKALQGKAIVVPGMINKLLKAMTALVPAAFTANLLQKKWSKALLKRCGTLRSPECEGQTVS